MKQSNKLASSLLLFPSLSLNLHNIQKIIGFSSNYSRLVCVCTCAKNKQTVTFLHSQSKTEEEEENPAAKQANPSTRAKMANCRALANYIKPSGTIVVLKTKLLAHAVRVT